MTVSALFYNNTVSKSLLFTFPGLEINFDLEGCDYAVFEEGSSSLNTPIKLQYRRNQNPFTVTVTPSSIDQAEAMGLGHFVNSRTISPSFRAISGRYILYTFFLLSPSYCLFPHYLLFIPIGSDFSSSPITVVVPANTKTFEVAQFFFVTDDNIDEDEQSFALVAEIGPDVPDGVSCFQLSAGDTQCNGRRGATEVRIVDNDCKLLE